MDGAALVDRGGRDQDAVLHDGMAGQRDIALLREYQPGVVDDAAARHPAAASTAIRRPGPGRDLVAARGRGLVGVGADTRPQDKIVAGRKLGLAVRRTDRA